MAVRTLQHIAQLDGLRGIAALLVLWEHFPYVEGSAISKSFWFVAHAARTGVMGVDIFFVLSGFLITRLLLKERDETGTISLKMFYLKRALRIFPIYYLCVIAYFVLFHTNFLTAISLLTYTFNYYMPFHLTPNPMEHTWSLSVEEQFYFIWPCFIMMIPLASGATITQFAIPVFSGLIAIIIAITFDNELAASLIFMSSFTRMMSLSLGAALAFRERAGQGSSDRNAYNYLLLGVSLLAGDYIARKLGLISGGGFYWSIALPGFACLSFGLVSVVIFRRDRFASIFISFLTNRTLRYIGKISYGIYLYHYLILYLLDIPPYKTENAGASFGSLLAAIAATFITAAVSYHFLEAPFLRIKARLKSTKGGAVVVL
jgi:peptidoglycan/LPS O-acetylase OafA/YrhL